MVQNLAASMYVMIMWRESWRPFLKSSEITPEVQRGTQLLTFSPRFKFNSSQCAYKGSSLTWNQGCVSANKYPQGLPSGTEANLQRTVCICCLPFNLQDRLVMSKVTTWNGALPSPKLCTGQNLCQQLFYQLLYRWVSHSTPENTALLMMQCDWLNVKLLTYLFWSLFSQ